MQPRSLLTNAKRNRRLIGVALAIALLVGLVAVVAEFVSLDRARVLIEQRITEATGREASIAGGVRIQILPVPRLEARKVTLAGPPGAASLSVAEVDLDFDWRRLVSGSVEVHYLMLAGVDLRLGTDGGGEPVEVEALVDEEVAGPLDLRVRRVEVESARIFGADAAADSEPLLRIDHFALDGAKLHRPVRLAARGAFDGSTFRVTARGGTVAELLDRESPFSVSLKGVLADVEIEGEGTVEEPFTGRGWELTVQLRARDLTAFAPFLAIDERLPALGPIAANGTLRDRGEGIGLSDARIDVGPAKDRWVALTGTVDDLVGFRGVSLHVSLDVADARRFLAHWGQGFPSAGPIRGTAHLHDRDGSLGLHDVDLVAGHGEDIDLRIGGSFGNLREIDEVRFDAKLRAGDLRALGSLFDARLPAVGPVAFEGQVTGAKRRVRADLTLRLDETEFAGEAGAAFPDRGRPRITVRLASPTVRLGDIGIEPRPGALVPDDGSDATGLAWLMEDRAVPLEWLTRFDAEVDLRADHVTGRAGFAIRDTHVALTLADGVLVSREARSELESGTVTTDFRIDANRSIPSFRATALALGVDVSRLLAQFTPKHEEAGRADIALELSTQGNAVSELRSLLDGRVEARLRDGSLGARLGREFVRELARISIPSLSMNQGERFDCIAMAFDVADGVANVERLRIDGERAVVAGTGSIDLGKGEWRLRLIPRARNASLVSMAVAVDVSGPLDDPKLTPIARTAATSAVRAVFDNVLNPARLVLRPFGLKKIGEAEASCPEPFDPFPAVDGPAPPDPLL